MGKVFAIKVGPEFESPKHIKITVEGIWNLRSPTVTWRVQMGELEEATGPARLAETKANKKGVLTQMRWEGTN